MSYDLDAKLICSQLESSDHRKRSSTLTHLRELCLNAPPEGVTMETLAADFDALYLHLLKCYGDRFESVRDCAVLAVSAFLERLPPMDFHLLNVVATLAERMGQVETVEPSEEIRLHYIGQLHMMLSKYVKMGNVGVFRECYAQVVKVLVKSIKDDYAAVQREGCATLVELCTVADTRELRPYTDSLAVALYSMLNHRHSAARISAIEALGRVALHIDPGVDGLRRLIMEVSPLLMDSMPLVRRECGQMGILLLLELVDRYSYFDRILPLVLCCLKDESPEVQSYIRPLWVKCGAQYYMENEAELSQQDICDVPAENYPVGVQRPTIGCRGIVQRCLRLLKLIARESGDWKDNVRLHSVKLMYQFVLHAEAAMTAKFIDIYPELAVACCDREPEVCAEAYKVADLLGRVLEYKAWIDNGFDGLERNARESYLTCFYYMFTAALGGDYEQLLRLCKLLKRTEYSHTLKPGFQLYILKTLETVLNKSSKLTVTMDHLQELYQLIYVSAMKVMALSYALNSEEDNQDVKFGMEIVNRIVQLEEISLAELHERWFSLALVDVDNLDALLDENAEPVLMLYGLIHLGRIRSTYLNPLIEKIKVVFEHCSDSAQVRIFTILSIASLDWSKTVRAEGGQSTQLLVTFIKQIVEPYLVWKAGSSREAMRSLAMATLCALAQGASEAREILPSLAEHMPSLLEDHNVSTRHYAVRASLYFQGMSVDNLKPLAYSTMQRMDDPSAGIRVIAAKAVGKLRPVFKTEPTFTKEEVEHEQEIWQAFIKRAMDILLLYYESPEKDMQAAAKQSLTEMAQLHPAAWEERYKRALSMTQSEDTLTNLYEQMTIATTEEQPTAQD